MATAGALCTASTPETCQRTLQACGSRVFEYKRSIKLPWHSHPIQRKALLGYTENVYLPNISYGDCGAYAALIKRTFMEETSKQQA